MMDRRIARTTVTVAVWQVSVTIPRGDRHFEVIDIARSDIE